MADESDQLDHAYRSRGDQSRGYKGNPEAIDQRRTDTAYLAREAKKAEDAKSPLEKRVDRIEGASFECGTGIQITGSVKEGFNANVSPAPNTGQNVDAALGGLAEFQVIMFDNSTIRIALGTVQDQLIGGLLWTPTGMSPGDDPIYTFSVSAPGYAWLDVQYATTAGSPFNITSVTIGHGSAVPPNTFGESFVSLGSWGFSSGITTVSGQIGSQAYNFCGLDNSGSAQFGPA